MKQCTSELRKVLAPLGVVLTLSPCALAQVPSPVALMDEVMVRYRDTMEAQFVHHLTSEIWDGSQTMTGTVQLWGDQYRIETLSEVITGKGDETWIYRPQENQVLITTVDGDGLAYSPSVLFRSYRQLYRPHVAAREVLGEVVHLRLELFPIDENFAISSLTLWIREHDRIVTRMVALDQSLTRTEITLKNVRVGIPLPSDTFEFEIPEGVEVIDLRS